MKVLIAIDSFKGSLTSEMAGESAKKGVLEILPDAKCDIVLIGDGGEGTMHSLKMALGATEITLKSTDPLGREIDAKYFASEDCAIIDMCECAGITLLSESERKNADGQGNSAPMVASTYGVGTMIRHAIGLGYRNFLVGIGGSVTNDGGTGMLRALGFSLLDGDGKEIQGGAYGAGCVAKIDDIGVIAHLDECRFTVLCDVDNPLLGENGCSYIFSPQKGASEGEIPVMDKYLSHFARVAGEYNPSADPSIAGSGAAGGIGFAFNTFLNSTLRRGVDVVSSAWELERRISEADLVITGEGKMDSQSAHGKAPIGVALLGKKHGKRVIAMCGITGDGYEKCYEKGIYRIYPIADPNKTLSENMSPEIATQNMINATKQAIKEMYLK